MKLVDLTLGGEWQGFMYLCGYMPRVSVGTGMGVKFVTLEKPIPTVRVHGFLKTYLPSV